MIDKTFKDSRSLTNEEWNAIGVFEIAVQGFPPIKRSDTSVRNTPEFKHTKECLERIMKNRTTLEGRLGLEINVKRKSKPTADADNMISGICDVLQDSKVIINDRFIKEIHYSETPSNKDLFYLKVWKD